MVGVCIPGGRLRSRPEVQAKFRPRFNGRRQCSASQGEERKGPPARLLGEVRCVPEVTLTGLLVIRRGCARCSLFARRAQRRAQGGCPLHNSSARISRAHHARQPLSCKTRLGQIAPRRCNRGSPPSSLTGPWWDEFTSERRLPGRRLFSGQPLDRRARAPRGRTWGAVAWGEGAPAAPIKGELN